MANRVESRSRLVKAPAAEIFALLTDPSRHSEIDGSGMVQGAHKSAPHLLALGSRFEMHMKQAGSPYRTVNEVVEFEEPHLIAWAVHPSRRLARVREFLFGSHRWRYRLSDHPDGTIVEEEWDFGCARSPWLLQLLRFPSRNAAAIEHTLDNLERRYC